VNSGYRKTIFVLTCAALLFSPDAGARAAEVYEDPAIIVSLAKVDRLLADVGYLTRAAGTPEVGGLVTIMAGEFIQGLDTKKPLGVVLTMNGPQPSGLAFVGVSDFDLVTSQIEESVGDLQDVGNGILRLDMQRSIYLKKQDGWVFISDSAENLATLPANPVALLGDLPATYEVAVQVNVQNISPEIREMALQNIQQGMDQQLARQNADADEREARDALAQQSLENMRMLLNETEQFLVGWGVDQQAGVTFLNVGMTAVEGSKLATQMLSYGTSKSGFAGVALPDAAATVQFNSQLNETDIPQIVDSLKIAKEQALEQVDEDDELPTEESRKAVKRIIVGIFEVITDTVKNGKLDGAASLALGPQSVQLLAGGYVADGLAIEREVKRLLELAKEVEDNPQLDNVKLNRETHRDVNLHTLALPVPADEADARRVLGDQVDIALGTSTNSIYLAVGPDALQILKDAIDRNAEGIDGPPLPMSLQVALSPIAQFVASLDDEPALQRMADVLESNADRDGISITASSSAERALSYRIEVQEGVLSLIGQGMRMQNER